jgi:WD40 repeat protein
MPYAVSAVNFAAPTAIKITRKVLEAKVKFRGKFCVLSCLAALAALIGSSCLTAQAASTPSKGAGKILVHPKFGGAIFGWDLDQSGTQGILTEAGGSVSSAVETFDLKTGKIVKVVSTTGTNDQDVTLGVVGTSVGLTEDEHVGSNGFVDRRTYHLVNPLTAGKFTGLWTPPDFNKNQIIFGVSRNQGTSTNAFYVSNNASSEVYVFGSDVAKNTFGRKVILTDPDFQESNNVKIAFDSATNSAVLAVRSKCESCAPEVGIVNLTTGEFSSFTFRGNGFGGEVGGLAVDSDDGIVCTTTEEDGDVEFYDLNQQTGFAEALPVVGDNPSSGADVEFDPVHKLFLVAQPNAGLQQGPSMIYVYNIQGTLVESLSGFTFSNRFAVIGMHIGIHPETRSGFVDDQSNQNVPNQLRSFTY